MGLRRFRAMFVKCRDKQGQIVQLGNTKCWIAYCSKCVILEPYAPYVSTFPLDQRRAMFVTGSVKTGLVPMAMCLDSPGYIERLIMNTMGTYELRVMQWVLGNSIRDPVDKALGVCLLGTKGGEGKSTIVNMIRDCFEGCTVSADLSVLGNSRARLSVEITRLVASTRVALVGDLALVDDINSSVWKSLTCGDYVQLEGTDVVKSYCSMIIASNDLYRPSGSSDNRWFTRRTILLGMKQLDRNPPVTMRDTTGTDRMRFVMSCVALRESSEHPPVTLRMAISTILGTAMQICTRAVVYVPTATPAQCVAGIESICALTLQLSHTEFVELVESINPALVGDWPALGMRYVKGIACRGI